MKTFPRFKKSGATNSDGRRVWRFFFVWVGMLAWVGALPVQALTAPYTVETLAGTGIFQSASFNNPEGVAVDSSGNVYVADTGHAAVRKIAPDGTLTTLAGVGAGAPENVAVDGSGNVYVTNYNNTILKITPAGVLTTFAGTAGVSGSADGSGPAAQFNSPQGIGVDGSGNVYVADSGNDTIREITPGGMVTTLAGTVGVAGSVDATGTAAQFNTPNGLAVDRSGNVYVTSGNAIRMIASGGVVMTVINNLASPSGLAVDGSGNLYASEYSSEVIVKVTGGVATNLAGTPYFSGRRDGPGATAQFYYPEGVAVDGSGNVYVADSINSLVREISPAGAVTTLAKSFPGGSVDGPAQGEFSSPEDVVADGSGNLYVADTNNNAIRKITAAGAVVTLAGGSLGSADGTGSAAQFNQPSGLAVDTAGNVYVADTGNDTIRMITSAGVVTTLAGAAGVTGTANGPALQARFNQPEGVAVDTAGNVYVSDTFNFTIRKITAGTVSTFATVAYYSGGMALDGSGNIYVVAPSQSIILKITSAGTVTTLSDSTGTAIPFYLPIGVAVDGSGNLYVTNNDGSTVSKVTPAGVVTTLAGTYGVYGFTDGPGSTALFDGPIGLTVDGSGNVYVADDGNNSIRKVTSQGVVTTLFPPAQFSRPSGTAVDGFGNIYVADTANDTIRKITPGKVVVTFAGTAGVVGSADGISAAARFHSPQGVALDGSGNVYVADSGNDTIRKITPSGVVTTLAGAAGVIGSTDAVTATAARFNNPTGVALDGSSNIFVADSGNDTIREITTAGVVSTFAGTAGASGSTNNTGPAARFNLPTGVAVDTNYNVYVADAGNELIRKITSAGVVTTLAGMVGVSGLTDATTGTAAQFNNPTGVAVDGSGNVYVADTGNHTVRGITSAGAVTTLSGVAEVPGFQDGPPGELNGPQGIAVDARGNFYVADTRNNAIREGLPDLPYTSFYSITPVVGEQVALVNLDSNSNYIKYSIVSGPATISGVDYGNIITFTGTGPVTLGVSLYDPTGPNGGSYAPPAPEPLSSGGVQSGTQSISPFTAIPTQAYGEAPFTIATPTANDASGQPVTMAVQSGPAALSGNTITVTGLGTVVLTADQAPISGYTAATEVTTNFTVGPGTQTISAFSTISTQTYGEAPFAITPPTDASGSGQPVVVTVKTGPATISGNTVTLTGAGTVVLAADQAAATNYNAATEVTTSFTVNPESQTIPAFSTITTKTYGMAPFAITPPTDASGSGQPVVVTVKTGPATISGSMVTLTGAGAVVLAADQAAATNYNAATEVTTSFTVNPESQAIPAFSTITTKTYGTAPFAITPPSDPSGSGQPVVVTVKSGPATISGSMVTLTGAGTVVLAADQAATTNYNAATEVTTSFTVNPESQTIPAFSTITTKTYGMAPFAITPPTDASGSGQPIVVTVKTGPATISGSMVTLTGAGTVVLAADQAGTTNYSAATEVTTNFTVQQATLTYTATAATRPYGAANPTFTGGVGGFVNGDSQISATTGSLTFSSTATATSSVGTYPITVSGLSATNYVFQQATGNATALSVTPMTLTITANPESKISGITFIFTTSEFTPSGLQNGETVGAVTLASTGAVSSAGVGIYAITASGATGGTFNPANYTINYVAGSLTVTAPGQVTTQTFTQWEAQPTYFSPTQMADPTISGLTAIPDHDDVPNLLKYLYDINPARLMTAPDRAGLPVLGMTTIGNEPYLTLSYRQYAGLTGVTLNVQTSPDLKSWTTVTPDFTDQTGTDPVTGDPILEIEVKASGSRQFLRLNVTSP